jgi:prophage antirepressor-like protein
MTAFLNSYIKTNDNPFTYSSIDINTAIDDKGEVWFVAKEVFEALQISWKGSFSIKKLPESWFTLRNLRTIKGDKETLFINEPALYFVSFRSNKPEALKFTMWVCSEVLPLLRRQGYYGNIPIKELNTLRYQKIKLLQELVGCRDEFAKAAYITSLHNVCNLLGEPMPDVALLGKKTSQLELRV